METKLPVEPSPSHGACHARYQDPAQAIPLFIDSPETFIAAVNTLITSTLPERPIPQKRPSPIAAGVQNQKFFCDTATGKTLESR
jgi:hypothetical protein